MTRKHISRYRGFRTLWPLVLAALVAPPAAAQQAVVHAVLFYSPTCPHCHKVLAEDFPPLTKKYGSHLVVAGVDVSTTGGYALFEAAARHFGLKPPRYGVPTLVVGSDVMVGDREIPERFPGLIEKGLAAGGVGWPRLPALRKALEARGLMGHTPPAGGPAARTDTTDTTGTKGTSAGGSKGAVPPAHPGDAPPDRGGAAPTSAAPTGASPSSLGSHDVSDAKEPEITMDPALPPSPGPLALFRRDPVGNGAAVVVLLCLLTAILSAVGGAARGRAFPPRIPKWTLPVLATIGMGVASYLAFVEVTGQPAVCGPVGDCLAVQQSPYAVLFGMVPVGILGQVGYLAMFTAWMLAVLGSPRVASVTWSVLWGMALVGTGFSAYLTYLEPFVIGATCIWCLTSAVVMALMLLSSTPLAIPERQDTALS